MGCDIHLFVEMKADATWWFKAEYYIDRSYSLFSVLADVRNPTEGDPYFISPISPPRGLPDNVSWRVGGQYDKWRSDAHSASWLLVSELLSYDWLREILVSDGKKVKLSDWIGDFLRHDLEAFRAMGNPDETRIVFWFDN